MLLMSLALCFDSLICFECVRIHIEVSTMLSETICILLRATHA